MDAFEGRTAVVTGGGSGIGRAVAQDLAARGATVVVVGRGAEALEETRRGARAGSVRVLAADVREPGWLAELERLAPRVDLLVSNAAAFAPYARTDRVEVDAFDRVADTVLRGSWLAARHMLTGMMERGFGRIVHVGSVAASSGARGQSAYAAAKAGLVGLTRSLAVEAGRGGVTCNLVELGLVRTERVEAALAPETLRRLERAAALGRAGTVAEAAGAIRFLLGPDAAFVTGATLRVDGGLGLGLAEDGA